MDDDITSQSAQNQLDDLTLQMTGISNEQTNESTQPTPPSSTETPVSEEQTLTTQSPEPQAEAQTTEPTQAPTSEVTDEVATPTVDPEQETEEEYGDFFQPTYGEVPTLDLSQIPQDEEGNIDAVALAQAMQARDQAILAQASNMVQQLAEQRQEEKLWNKAFEAHPEIRKDRAFADDINALRFGDFANQINTGREDARMMTPKQAFDRISKRFATQSAEAVKAATTSVKVQESVYAEPVGNASVSSADTERQHFQNLRSSDPSLREAAADALLSKRLFGG